MQMKVGVLHKFSMMLDGTRIIRNMLLTFDFVQVLSFFWIFRRGCRHLHIYIYICLVRNVLVLLQNHRKLGSSPDERNFVQLDFRKVSSFNRDDSYMVLFWFEDLFVYWFQLFFNFFRSLLDCLQRRLSYFLFILHICCHLVHFLLKFIKIHV